MNFRHFGGCSLKHLILQVLKFTMNKSF